MATKLSDEIKALVRGANFAHLATLMPDGSPQVAPVWVDLAGDRILVCTGEASLKAKNTKRDARVALSVIAMDNPYKEAQLRRSEEHTSELQSPCNLVCRLLLEKKQRTYHQ